jgi:hypothetical protein
VNNSRALLLALVTGLMMAPVVTAHSPPAGARVYFIGLQEGDVVRSPVRVQFGIEGFGITPAGTRDRRRHTAGHHHLLVNVTELPPLDEAIPRDDRHLHFDQGETETVLELPPGRHTLQLLLGDEEHEPFEPVLMSEKITVIVEGK